MRIAESIRCPSRTITLALAAVSIAGIAAAAPGELLPIPDKLVVLTFDDCNKSDITVVAPILTRHRFGGTFYFTRGLGAATDHEHFLTWEEAVELDRRGFEIGNHTRDHRGVEGLTAGELREEIEFIQNGCKKYGIPAPVTFCYPGFGHNVAAVRVLEEKEFLFARRGVRPEYPDGGHGARGPAYDPRVDHPLLIPTTGYAGPEWGMDDLKWAVDQARDGRIAVITFHGVPGPLHPWVHCDPKDFARYMQYLKDEGCTCIAVRDLVKYVDPHKRPADPYAPIRERANKLSKSKP